MTKLLSNLQVGSFVGEGCFGKVYLGVDDVHGDVAVKIISYDPNKETSAGWLQRSADLLSEGKRLREAVHENVVQVHYLVKSDTGNDVFLVMEYCKGGSLLAQYNLGPMSIDSVRKHATAVSLGLHSLHSRGMLHRDIKPSNILCHGSGRTKIGDFGLVTNNLVLGYGSEAGYADHVAPEVWQDGLTSTKTDIWALGMTIYRILHGHFWYTMMPRPASLVNAGNFRDTLKWLPHIPADWKRVVRKMLHDDPGLRYGSATEILNALANCRIAPLWQVELDADNIRWQRSKNDRKITVFWKDHNHKICSWYALSEPKKYGNKRRLGGSDRIKSAACQRQLTDFFSSQT